MGVMPYNILQRETPKQFQCLPMYTTPPVSGQHASRNVTRHEICLISEAHIYGTKNKCYALEYSFLKTKRYFARHIDVQ